MLLPRMFQFINEALALLQSNRPTTFASRFVSTDHLFFASLLMDPVQIPRQIHPTRLQPDFRKYIHLYQPHILFIISLSHRCSPITPGNSPCDHLYRLSSWKLPQIFHAREFMHELVAFFFATLPAWALLWAHNFAPSSEEGKIGDGHENLRVESRSAAIGAQPHG